MFQIERPSCFATSFYQGVAPLHRAFPCAMKSIWISTWGPEIPLSPFQFCDKLGPEHVTPLFARAFSSQLVNEINENGKKLHSPDLLQSRKKFKHANEEGKSYPPTPSTLLANNWNFASNLNIPCNLFSFQDFLECELFWKREYPLITYEPPTYDESTEPVISLCAPKENGRIYSNESTFRGKRPSSRNYVCPECEHVFNRKCNLKRHQVLHSGLRPFACNECGDTFTQISNLTYHQRIHMNEFPYVCHTCDKRFRSSSNLKRHRRIHTGEKPYSCSTCSMSFGSWDQWKRHERTKGHDNM